MPCGDCGQTRDRHVHLQDSWTSARRAAEPVLLSHLAGTWGCGAPCTRDALSAGEGRSHCTHQSLIQFLKAGAGGGAILVLLFVAGGQFHPRRPQIRSVTLTRDPGRPAHSGCPQDVGSPAHTQGSDETRREQTNLSVCPEDVWPQKPSLLSHHAPESGVRKCHHLPLKKITSLARQEFPAAHWLAVRLTIQF